jgi:hypothetical protein
MKHASRNRATDRWQSIKLRSKEGNIRQESWGEEEVMDEHP